jgi:nucleoside-diphosphate-sugar epimerase
MYTIITGVNGFIGSNLLARLKNSEIITVSRKDPKNLALFRGKKEVSYRELQNHEVKLVHLATYFSKEQKDIEKIKSANIDFGVNLLDVVANLNIKKIIYTNTMYSYYEDDSIRELYYTKTKNEFSNIISDFSRSRNVAYDEIFLDNTFGLSDKRKKVIPIIANHIKNSLGNPIQNSKNNINLMHVNDVVERIKISIDNDLNYLTSFVGRKSINLTSIYLFLNNFFNGNQTIDSPLLYVDNSYLEGSPEINYLNIDVEGIEKKLIEYIKLWK